MGNCSAYIRKTLLTYCENCETNTNTRTDTPRQHILDATSILLASVRSKQLTHFRLIPSKDRLLKLFQPIWDVQYLVYPNKEYKASTCCSFMKANPGHFNRLRFI